MNGKTVERSEVFWEFSDATLNQNFSPPETRKDSSGRETMSVLELWGKNCHEM